MRIALRLLASLVLLVALLAITSALQDGASARITLGAWSISGGPTSALLILLGAGGLSGLLAALPGRTNA